MIKSFDIHNKQVDNDALISENKKSWEQRVKYDINSAYYDIKSFMAGKNSLFDTELEELRGFIKGKRILHIQSYLGLDSLSFCRLGADEVVGLDFNSEAVSFANDLAQKTNLNAKFFIDDLTKSTSQIQEIGVFDLIFCSYGALCWIPKIEMIVNKASKFLKPEGVFYLIDFHPMVYTLGLLQDTKVSFPFDNSVPLVTSWEGTYASPKAPLKSKEFNWNHSTSEVINAFSKNNYTIKFFNEHVSLPMEAFYNLQKKNDQQYYSKFNNEFLKIPLSLSLMAAKNV